MGRDRCSRPGSRGRSGVIGMGLSLPAPHGGIRFARQQPFVDTDEGALASTVCRMDMVAGDARKNDEEP